jgi:hypothetical protein
VRIRQIKPDFWKDARMADLSEGARLFYVGTWQLCDDAGWMRWDVAGIAAELYPFEPRKAREKRVERHATALVGLGRLHIHDCGHAQVPKMPAHQHLAGTTRRVLTVAQEHNKCSEPATTRDYPRLPAPVSIGSVRVGSVSREGIPKAQRLRQDEEGRWTA